jgi:ferredoxin, 2Fe-2S
MPRLMIIDRGGTAHEVVVECGVSVMEAIRNGGIDDVLGLCGGCCSCATCHVFVDPAWLSVLQPPSRDEADLLDGSSSRSSTSRLSCQILVQDEYDGMRLTIAPEE